MNDPLVQLRQELLAQHPSLSKYVPKNKVDQTQFNKPSETISERPKKKKTINRYDDGYTRMHPKKVNNEVDVYKHWNKMFKKVQYGAKDDFLIHRGLNPKPRYRKSLCEDKLEDMENKKSLTLAARETKVKEYVEQKNKLAEESEARRDSLKNMASYQAGVADDLVKHNRAKAKLTLANAERAMIDQQEEMRDFYGFAGSTQVLAMRELQIEDHKHFKRIGLESKDIYFQEEQKKDDGPSEYEEMVSKRINLKEKNKKIVSVLKNQALEREVLKGLEVEENMENAERLDALAEAELAKRMNEKEQFERDKQKHFDTFNAIVDYRDYLRGVRVAEDEALYQREKDFLVEKGKFNQAWKEKQDAIEAKRQRLLSTVKADLSSEYEKHEQLEKEYYYTLEKERDLQIQDQLIQEKLAKKEAMAELMRDWERIREANKLIKEQQRRIENEEKDRMMKFIELENNAKKAEERKRMVEKDINRMEIMYQINEREEKRRAEHEEKMREIKLLRAEGFVREGKLKERMLERMEEFKSNGLPERFLSNIRKHQNL